MRLTIRPATMEDVGFLTDVSIVATKDQGLWPDDADEDEFRAGFADWTREQVRGEVPDSTTSVLELDGRRVGRLRVVRTAEVLELAGLQLHPDVQSRGLGSEVLESLIEEARSHQLAFELSVDQNNPRARALYERHGLRSVGADETEDRLRLDP